MLYEVITGFLGAKTLDLIFTSYGHVPKRDELATAAESAKELDIGVGYPIGFSKRDHQGMKRVYITTARGGAFIPATFQVV